MITKETEQPQVFYLKDYQAPEYSIEHTELHLDLQEEFTRVKSLLKIKKTDTGISGTLVLDGRETKLISVKKNGKSLVDSEYELTPERLRIHVQESEFTIEIENEIYPHKNLSLDGLYKSDSIYCSQNEPEGFRKITYFMDRPDVMSRFKTTIVADKSKYPHLLSNGNLIKSGELDNGRHYATWEDPFPKPAYLFALVAGDLDVLEDTFITKSKRSIDLKIYVDKGKLDRAGHAMTSLKKSMKWDETRFNLEYDLDLYMIVAVDAFNFGAMENKGLNIFNSQFVLADPKTATDRDYQGIEGVIGHEYFHNWSGNRVTLRDWFQITLKEGFTVFRDEEFSSDMNSRPVKRIEDVNALREMQFKEDASPMAHPIQPSSFIRIDNFYTSTVYNKGAEIIRMIYTLLGHDTFHKGAELYFKTFDGQAVTTEAFLWAMEKASGYDLTQFRHWYTQAGTPEVAVESTYDSAEHSLTLTIHQTCRPTRETKTKEPFYFPIKMGLLGESGKEIPLQLAGEAQSDAQTTRIIPVSKAIETLKFVNVSERAVPSLFRDFSAPVTVKSNLSDVDLALLLKNDTNAFNRYEAGQQLAKRTLLKLVSNIETGTSLKINTTILEAYSELLSDHNQDAALIAEALVLPTQSQVLGALDHFPVDAVFEAREFFLKTLAQNFQDQFLQVYNTLNTKEPYAIDPESIGKRSLKNLCLSYLSLLDGNFTNLALEQFNTATNMTDEIAALRILCKKPSAARDVAVKSFYEKWNQDTLVINKWFTAQAAATYGPTLETIKTLEKDPAFNPKNPNNMRSLYRVFSQNLVQFHQISGAGYEFLADRILSVDEFNPNMGAGFTKEFNAYPKLDSTRKALMRNQIERILSKENLSKNTFEIASQIVSSDI